MHEHTLRHSLSTLWRREKPEFMTALDSVSLQISDGQTVGIIGRNGAGKSTLLRVLSGIVTPTHGTIAISRKVTPLLELGIGFHPEMSGRENCYMAGALLGLTPPEVKLKLPAIIEFSELADFIDIAVKNYSSGMYARLAFALAIEIEPEILLLDEILGVGDEFFQRKCLYRMQTLIKKGLTSVIISHNLDYLVSQCNRLVWLSQGRVVADGIPAEIARQYRAADGRAI